jgi:hypothetical protein
VARAAAFECFACWCAELVYANEQTCSTAALQRAITCVHAVCKTVVWRVEIGSFIVRQYVHSCHGRLLAELKAYVVVLAVA